MRRFRRLHHPGLRFVAFTFVATLFYAPSASAQEADRRHDAVWNKIVPFFQPPEELAKDLGNYRSPLVFDDGRPVQTPEQWQQRRKEILHFWHAALGPWPPLIEEPAVKVLQTENREGGDGEHHTSHATTSPNRQ